jgi:glycosyltransferase involved in cell wall biosynthesis
MGINSIPIKILFVIADLEGWGAQRVIVNLISSIDRERFLPILVLSRKKGIYLDELPGDIHIYDLGRRSAYDLPKLIFGLARIISKESPNIVFSALFHANIITLLARFIFRVPCRIIISEHISQIGYKYSKHSLLHQYLRKRLYPRAHLIVAVSKGVKNDLMKSLRIPPEKIKVIYNPLNIEKIMKLAEEEVNNRDWNYSPLIISVGRLDIQKGHPYLLKAFSIVRRRIPSKLMIIGDGEEMGRLKEITERLGVEEDVLFMGYQKNPYKYMAKSHLFANPSIYEGFGYTILESMALGIPVIATACPHGPDEIIEDGKNGLLVPVADEEALAGAIIRTLEDERLRDNLSVEGRKRTEDFSANKIISEYEEIFIEAAKV